MMVRSAYLIQTRSYSREMSEENVIKQLRLPKVPAMIGLSLRDVPLPKEFHKIISKGNSQELQKAGF